MKQKLHGSYIKCGIGLLAIALCLFSAAFWTSIASAEIIMTTATGSGADTYLSNDSQSSSYYATVVHGSTVDMQARISTGSRTRIPYFRFDISSAAGTNLTGAILSFYMSYNNGNRKRTWNVYGLNDGSGDSWGESTTDYANAPGILQPSTYNDGNYSLDIGTSANQLTLLGAVTFPASTGVVVTSTTASLNLDSFLAADTNGLVTFVLVAQSSDSNANYSFATKENTSSWAYPTLDLPNAVVPEPAALAMLFTALAAMGGLITFRKRRVK
ncbi:MAG: DNRLRE domain-containing protein [Thermoguttaceae bacterium]|jgi:hypothetical protein